MEIALDLMPGTSKVGILVDVDNPSNAAQLREVEAATGKSGVSALPVDVHTVDKIGVAIQAFVRERVGVVIVLAAARFLDVPADRELCVGIAVAHGVYFP